MTVSKGFHNKLPKFDLLFYPKSLNSQGLYFCTININENFTDLVGKTVVSNIFDANIPQPTLFFSTKPEKFKLDTPFIARCTVTNFNETQMKDFYYIFYYFIPKTGLLANKTVPIAYYYVNFDETIFKLMTEIDGLQVIEGSADYSNFTTLMLPKTSNATGKYRCSMQIDTNEEIWSNIWNNAFFNTLNFVEIIFCFVTTLILFL